VSLCRADEVLAEAVVASEHVERVDLEVPLARLVRPKLEVRLRVVAAEDGAPIAGARASLLLPGRFGSALDVSDAEGVVRIAGELAGRRWLTVIASGRQWLQREVVVPAGEAEVDLGSFALTRSASIRGRVVGAASGCMDVLAYPLERFEETRTMRGSFGASSAPPDSRWELQGLGRERYLLRLANADWAALPVVVDTREGDVWDVEIRAERGSEVRFELAEPPADGLLRIETKAGLPVLERELAGAREVVLRLVPGEYDWQATGLRHGVARGALRVDRRDLVVPIGR
jgi:hypothetical protein